VDAVSGVDALSRWWWVDGVQVKKLGERLCGKYIGRTQKSLNDWNLLCSGGIMRLDVNVKNVLAGRRLIPQSTAR
jgi:hypothetical protein